MDIGVFTALYFVAALGIFRFRCWRSPRHALSAFFMMVSLGRDGRPRPVAPYIPMIPDEIKLHTLAEKRKIARGRVPQPENH
ncbi:hypothetical protein [Pseudoramibacter faecis]|uniref:hypothetical protein n=1 Tax=Pseudoramibacter faecis TaxID=3108534 RepID=UPI002E78F23B|nr:hypothetical protein [Pseudoramibacter sp. HA2172]